ncbi:Uncharacterized protein HZ326_14456 [Fusarium oxysporum f. sp. albedinis]|nr:Uncharacterized protein HZ326_14456 [Fusarium oxysporum f. sp. albedinis]
MHGCIKGSILGSDPEVLESLSLVHWTRTRHFFSGGPPRTWPRPAASTGHFNQKSTGTSLACQNTNWDFVTHDHSGD